MMDCHYSILDSSLLKQYQVRNQSWQWRFCSKDVYRILTENHTELISRSEQCKPVFSICLTIYLKDIWLLFNISLKIRTLITLHFQSSIRNIISAQFYLIHYKHSSHYLKNYFTYLNQTHISIGNSANRGEKLLTSLFFDGCGFCQEYFTALQA